MQGTVTINVIGHSWGGYLYRGSLRPADEPDAAYTYHAEAIPTDERFVFRGQLYLSGLPADDRERIAEYLDTAAGDFESVTDFEARLPDGSVIPWARDESECAYYDAMGEGE